MGVSLDFRGARNAVLGLLAIAMTMAACTPDPEASATAANPALGAACGLDVSLLFDRSGSVGEAAETVAVETQNLVDTLGLSNSRVKVASFSDTATVHPNGIAVGVDSLDGFAWSDAAGYTVPELQTGGGTNLEGGLEVLRRTGAGDLLVVFTDGNPNVHYLTQPNGHPGVHANLGYELSEAVSEANLIKAQGTHILAIGIGEVQLGTLTAVSGPQGVGTVSGIADFALLDSFGDLSDTIDDIANELCVEPLPEVVDIDSGSTHSCAVLDSGVVRCWGEGGSGQLGNGAKQHSSVAVEVVGISNATQVSAGTKATCALDGAEVKCWGAYSDGPISGGTDSDSSVPVTVQGLVAPTAISHGGATGCAIDSGQVKCWGYNGEGQLGDGSTVDSEAAVVVEGLVNPTQVAVGNGTACAIDGSQLKCWGRNNFGQLGDGTTNDSSLPIAVGGVSDPMGVDIGSASVCVVTVGAVQCWGRNSHGQLGDGTTTASLSPVTVANVSGAAEVAVGSQHACALGLDPGVVDCWGRNYAGQLGDGTTTDSLSPVEVLNFSNANDLSVGPTQLAAGNAHNCAVDLGQAVCWGFNWRGALGDGSTTNRSTPVKVQGLD